MMRSLSSAVAGLRTHQTKMDVIGNNIANVNTYGFKASRASFSDVYYQNLAGASSAQSTMGGTNPTQIGYGASVATIDMLITQSGSVSTDRALDVYIAGDGFLISQDATGKKQYSRLGTLYFDASGNLVDGNGHYILGFPMITDPDTGEVRPDIPPNGKAESSQLVPIKVTPPGSMTIEEFFETLTGISISTSGEIIGLQEGDTEIVLTSAIPGWMNKDSITITTESTYAGNVRLAISGLPTASAIQTAIGGSINVSKVEFGTMALEAGNYDITVDSTTNTVKLTNSSGVNLSGTYKDGKIILKNSNGDVGMTIHATGDLPDTSATPTTTYPTVGGNGNSFTFSSTTTNGNWATLLGLNASDITNLNITGTLPDDTYTVTVNGANVTIEGTGTPPTVSLTGTVNNGQLLLEDTSNNISITIDLAPITTTSKTSPLSLILHQQMSTTDLGGNTVKEPTNPAVFTLPAGPPYAFSFGEVSFTLNAAPTSALNAVIGTAGPGEGKRINIGNLALAKFRNNEGLQQSGTSYFEATPNSGDPVCVRPGLEGTGNLSAGYLEMSNVDISKEFTDMITTQRGFQANTRIITVSDEMLQELVNLKR